MRTKRNLNAFSTVELLIILAVVGILATGGIAYYSKIGNGVSSVKSDNQVSVLNSALRGYQAFGGSLEGVKTAEGVVAKLQSVSANSTQTVGLSGSFLQRNLTLEAVSPEENGQRLIWDPEKQRFAASSEQVSGFKLVVNSEMDEGNPATENREQLEQYAKESTWIWDYKESNAKTVASPTLVKVDNNPGGNPPPTPVEPIDPEIEPEPKQQLSPPVITPGGGIFSGPETPVMISISNPNPAGSSAIYYRIDYAAWNRYNKSTSIDLNADMVLEAQAIGNSPEKWLPSSAVLDSYKVNDVALDPPIIHLSAKEYDKKTDWIEITLENPNPENSSEIRYKILPIPGSGQSGSEEMTFDEPFKVWRFAFPDGFGVEAYARATEHGYVDSEEVEDWADDTEGLYGGHIDLDTSTSIAEIGKGGTDAHTHDITGKYGLTKIDMFNIPDSKQVEINEAITDDKQYFKLIVVNGNLSPGLKVSIEYEDELGLNQRIKESADKYDDTELQDLQIFSLRGDKDSFKLKKLEIEMSKDVLLKNGIIPSTTGAVKGNVPGRNGEWRNGALTVQAVAVDSDSKDDFYTDNTISAGGHGAATSGLLWEATMFWHWDGDSYDDESNTYEPGVIETGGGSGKGGKKKKK